jgi:CheY-like chemotaxis protein
MKIEVLIADDHAIIRDGLKKILADTGDMVGQRSHHNAALDKVRERDRGFVLDMSMPGRSGWTVVR